MDKDIEVKDVKLISFIANPPDQESPGHILNALNNDCIQEVFRRLKNIDDFLSVAEVCTQFQENARQCFPSAYKKFCSTHVRYYTCFHRNKCENATGPPLPLHRVKSFVGIFSDLIEKIEWGHIDEMFRNDKITPSNEKPYQIHKLFIRLKTKLKKDVEYDTNNLLVIADHCGNNLKDLQIIDRFIDFNVLQKFKALEKLTILNSRCLYTEAFNLGLFSNLKSMRIVRSYAFNGDWIQQTFPNLIEAEFSAINLDQNILIEFLKRNSQLERLIVNGIIWTDIDPSFWSAFEDSPLSNLQYLEIRHARSMHIGDHMKTFPKCFPNLKYVHITDSHAQSFTYFIILLSENCAPIEKLSLRSDLKISLPECIQKLEHIKTLKISMISKGTLLDICKQLPNLTWLTVNIGKDTENMEIFEALEYAKNLVSLTINYLTLDCVKIDHKFYYTLLNLVKGRIKVKLSFLHDIDISIDQSVLNMNEHWLKIKSNHYNEGIF